MIIDAWAQHPTLRHSQEPMFDSLRRWNQEPAPQQATIAAMDAAQVDKALISAWVAPRNVMISNDEVSEFVNRYPERLVGIGSVDISKPMQAMTEVGRPIYIYIDTSAYTIKRYPQQLIDYLKTNGKTKVLFGTNYPMITPAKALRELDGLVLDDDTKALFLSANTQRVYNLDV